VEGWRKRAFHGWGAAPGYRYTTRSGDRIVKVDWQMCSRMKKTEMKQRRRQTSQHFLPKTLNLILTQLMEPDKKKGVMIWWREENCTTLRGSFFLHVLVVKSDQAWLDLIRCHPDRNCACNVPLTNSAWRKYVCWLGIGNFSGMKRFVQQVASCLDIFVRGQYCLFTITVGRSNQSRIYGSRRDFLEPRQVLLAQ
jgi:hypothetical protein